MIAEKRILIASIVASCLSIVACVGVLTWWALETRIERKDRHRIITAIIFFDLVKAVMLLSFPARFVDYNNEIYSEQGLTFCRKVGFFTAYAIEANDFNTLFLAVHTAVVILGRERQLHQMPIYRKGSLVLFCLLLPGLFAGLGYIKDGYVPIIDKCYLKPFPASYTLALSWIPRGVVLCVVFLLYYLVCRHVVAQMESVDKELKVLVPQVTPSYFLRHSFHDPRIPKTASSSTSDTYTETRDRRQNDTDLPSGIKINYSIDPSTPVVPSSELPAPKEPDATLDTPIRNARFQLESVRFSKDPISAKRPISGMSSAKYDIAYQYFGTLDKSPLDAFDSAPRSRDNSVATHWRFSQTEDHRNLFWLSMLPYFGAFSRSNVALNPGDMHTSNGSNARKRVSQRISSWFTRPDDSTLFSKTEDVEKSKKAAEAITTTSWEIQRQIYEDSYNRFLSQKQYISSQMYFMFVYPLCYLLFWIFPLAEECMVYTFGIDPAVSTSRAVVCGIAAWSLRFTGFMDSILFYSREQVLLMRTNKQDIESGMFADTSSFSSLSKDADHSVGSTAHSQRTINTVNTTSITDQSTYHNNSNNLYTNQGTKSNIGSYPIVSNPDGLPSTDQQGMNLFDDSNKQLNSNEKLAYKWRRQKPSGTLSKLRTTASASTVPMSQSRFSFKTASSTSEVNWQEFLSGVTPANTS